MDLVTGRLDAPRSPVTTSPAGPTTRRGCRHLLGKRTLKQELKQLLIVKESGSRRLNWEREAMKVRRTCVERVGPVLVQ